MPKAKKATKRATKKSTPVKKAKIDKAASKMATDGYSPNRKIAKNNTWKKLAGTAEQFQGITVFAATDPYRASERKDFRSALNNPYVYRASRIHSTFVAGQGYTFDIIPRDEDDIEENSVEAFSEMEYYVPYYNKTLTVSQIKRKLARMASDMDLAGNVFNAYFTSLEQGRCVLALTPLEQIDDKWQMPEQLRLIRPEFTERPVISEMDGQLKGVRIVGVQSPTRDNILPTDRMLYIMHGYNNELFSDYYGDSKIARIADEANTLNIILNQDYERAAENTWHKPPIFSVPIPPQEYGNEEAVLNDFLMKANDSKGQSIAVTGPSVKDEVGVTVLNTPTNSDIAGLEIIRTGLIKAIITSYGLPSYMLSEGDVGRLGGNSNMEEIDSYLNQEIRPERVILEKVVERQYFDIILSIMFDVPVSDLPIKVDFKFNKPRLVTLITPEMFSVLTNMEQLGLIDANGMRDILGLEDLNKETLSKGSLHTQG